MFRDNQAIQILEDAVRENRYKKLLLQLNKDFEMANVSMEALTALIPMEVVTRLREKIYRLVLEDFTAYLNLLYIIDVPEKAFKDLELTDAVEVADQVGCLILKRELQKVRLKDKYSN